MEAMTRVLAMLLTVVPVLTGVAGCAARAPSGNAAAGASFPAGGASSPARASTAPVTAVTPSSSATAFVMPAGGPNPEAAIPNPGTGPGNPRLLRALLPQSSSGRESALLLPPAVVALPDRDLRSLFIGLRQYASPVVGPQACDGWTAGLSSVVVSSYNQPGVQLGAAEQSVPTQAGLPMFSETIITGPPSVLDALADPPLPAACRAITTPQYPGGVKPTTVPAPGPGAVSARAFEVTGTGKFPVWTWAEVIQGRGFLLEIRIPNQSANSDPGAALSTIAANAYGRAATVLA
jgi:hypothetical protein